MGRQNDALLVPRRHLAKGSLAASGHVKHRAAREMKGAGRGCIGAVIRRGARPALSFHFAWDRQSVKTPQRRFAGELKSVRRQPKVPTFTLGDTDLWTLERELKEKAFS
ncbi:hypothetical protein CDO26_24695 (plasmid) [Sinorhizobium meliloti]|nr:hypothetical protein CDO26_24695 [Sinorhizobium meliloti]